MFIAQAPAVANACCPVVVIVTMFQKNQDEIYTSPSSQLASAVPQYTWENEKHLIKILSIKSFLQHAQS